MDSNHPDMVAQRLLEEKEKHEQNVERSKKQTESLYALTQPFQTIKDSEGKPLVTRVPGGWIFYMWWDTGVGAAGNSTFVPYSDEFEEHDYI